MLYSALTFSYRASAASNARRFVDKFYGYRGATYLNWFGGGSAFVSSHAFNGALSSMQILLRNTLFGYYSLGLAPDVARQWSAELANGCAKGSAHYTRSHDPVATRTGLRWCERCAAEDEAQGRLTAWRLLHQLPFARHCQVHLTPLVIHCKRCELPFDDGRKFRLPGELCWNCGAEGASSTRRPPTQGEQRLLTRVDLAFRRQVDTYRPSNWASAVRDFSRQYGSSRSAEAALAEQLCSLWEVQTVDEVWGLLGLTFRSKDLMQAVSSTLVSSPLTLQLVVAEAIEILHPNIFSEQVQSARNDLLNDWAGRQLDAQRVVVLQHGATRGIAPWLMQTIASGRSPADAANAAGISKAAVERAVASLRNSLCSEVGQEAGRELLRAVLPRSKKVQAEARLSMYRAQVRNLVANEPGIKRTEIWHRLPTAITFLSRNDKPWLKTILPAPLRTIDQSDVDGRKSLYRQRIEAALAEQPPPSRSALWKRLDREMSWLRANDREWLDNQIPYIRRHRSDV